jgi:hypothetical protein
MDGASDGTFLRAMSDRLRFVKNGLHKRRPVQDLA